MADQVSEPSAEAKWEIVRKTAGLERKLKIREAESRLKKQEKVPADADFLVRAYRSLALEVAGLLLREQGRSTQVPPRRRPAGARSRSDSRFALGFFLGAFLTVAIVILIEQPWK